MEQKRQPAVFLGQTPAQTQISQGLQTPFVFADQLGELTLPELSFAVKLWSRRLLTLTAAIASAEANNCQIQANKARAELECMQSAFDRAIVNAISTITTLKEPALQFAQLIELSCAVSDSRFPQHNYNNLLVPLYLRYSHGAVRVCFKSARSEQQVEDVLRHIAQLNSSDHLALSNAGAALYVAESAPFEAVTAELFRNAEGLLVGPKEAYAQCRMITARAEQLKMFVPELFTNSGAEAKKTAQELVLHIYAQLLKYPNVYVYLHYPDIRYAYEDRGEHLDVFHQTSWAAVSALIRFIATGKEAYGTCVFPLCHKDALLNLQAALLAHFTQHLPEVAQWHAFMSDCMGDSRGAVIPIHRRAGCVPFIYAAVFQALAFAGDQKGLESTARQLWDSPALAARWALLPYYREKLFCGSKRMVHHRAYFDCLMQCTARITEQYAARNVYFSLFAAASQQFFSKQQLKFSKLDAIQQEQLLAWCESDIQCQQLLALLLLSFFQSEPSGCVCDRLLKVKVESDSTRLQLARSIAIFTTIPEVARRPCTYFWLLVMRQLTRGSCRYRPNRGHALFHETPLAIAAEARALVLRWIEPFQSESRFQTKFWSDFNEELVNPR